MAETEKQGTYGEVTSGLNQNKPKSGSSSGLGSVGSLYDASGNLISDSNPANENAGTRSTKVDLNDPNIRIGDYVFVNNKPVVVPGSLTDYYQKYVVMQGAQKKQSLSFKDWANALVTGFAARQGAPTDSSNVLTMAASWAVNSSARALNPYLSRALSAAQAGQQLIDVEKKYIDEWLNQNVTYDYAFDIKERDDGSRYIVIDYDKMKDAGYGSGSAVRDALDTSKSSVTHDGGYGLNVNITEPFAQSDRYKEILKAIGDAFPRGLSEEDANEVVDEETGATRLQVIDEYIRGEEMRFYYNASSIAEFKKTAPGASDQAIDAALNTQLIGSFNKKTLNKLSEDGDKVFIYDDQNNKIKVDPKKYLDDIYNMSDKERNDYMVRLGDRIMSEDISDDEKVILKAQANALYSASNNDDSGYGGMYKKGFWDSICDARDFTEMRIGRFFGNEELTTFEDNEVLSGLVTLGSGFLRIKTMQKMMGGLTNLSKLGITKLGSTVGGKLGDFTSKWASSGQDTSIVSMLQNARSGSYNSASDVLGDLAESGLNLTREIAADVAYESIKAGARKMRGEDFDFWDELSTDIVLDLIMQNGPSQIMQDLSAPRYEYRRAGDKKSRLPGSGDMDKLAEDYKKMQEAETKEAQGDEFYTGDGFDYGEYYGLVEVTAKDLAMRRANTIDKLTDNKLARKVGELFFDKNFAMYKLGLKALARTGDNLLFREAVRQSGGLTALTQDVINNMYLNADYNKAYKDFQSTLREAVPHARDLSVEDQRYMNAKANMDRFSIENKGDKKVLKKLHDTYDKHISGVSTERAAQLDKLMGKMRKVYAATINYYKEQGLLTPEEYKRVTSGAAYKNGQYFPVWTADTKFDLGGDIKQGRKDLRSVDDKTAFIEAEKFLNPLETFSKYQYALARNIAINERAKFIRDLAEIEGINITVTSDNGGGLGEFERLKEYSDGFKKVYNELKEEVDKEVPTFEEWEKANVEMAGRSKAFKNVDELGKLQSEMTNLQKKLRSLERKMVKGQAEVQKETVEEQLKPSTALEDALKIADEIRDVKVQIEQNRAAQFSKVDDIVRNTRSLLKRAQKGNKYLAMKLDVDTYVKTKVQGALKEAVKSGNSVGAVQNILNNAMNEANPYVSRETVLNMRASEAAVKYRKESRKANRTKYKNDKSALTKANKALDRFMDRISSGTKIEFDAPITKDSTISQILGNYTAKDEIRYLADGKVYTMKLKGAGAEDLVNEFYNGEKIATPKNITQKVAKGLGRASGAIAMTKRALTTATDVARVLPNLVRDWTRGIVTTGGTILMSPNNIEDYPGGADLSKLDAKARQRIEAAWKDAASRATEGTTLTESLAAPKARGSADLVRVAQVEGTGNVFTRFIVDAHGKGVLGTIKAGATFLQDSAESYTRQRAANTAYNKQLADSLAAGKDVDTAIKDAVSAAAFYGREATTNFSRRGVLISKIARQVPYLSQKFGSLVSLANTYLDNPIAVSRAMKASVGTYSALIAIALSNEESRKKYFLLSEYDRANNVIVALDNDTIITIPLDDNIAAFLTPYRRMIESLNGVDPEAFYMWAKDYLEALSPLDIDGFSEGDKINIQRGIEKLGAQLLPTWMLPFVENMFGRDWYYGSDIKVTEKEAAEYYDNPNPSAGDLTTTRKNSKLLADIANATGIPQWQLQTIWNTYLGNVGQYALYTINKISGSPEKYQGGKDWVNSIFKPFTGADSDAASSAMWEGTEMLKEEKHKLRKELAEIKQKLVVATGDDKIKLEQQRQEKISAYGMRVSDFVNQYLNAYEITGGLSQSDKSRIWHLYDIWTDENEEGINVSLEDSLEGYYNDKAKKAITQNTDNLAAKSWFDKYAGTNLGDYYSSYGERAFKNSMNGRSYRIMAKIASVVEDTSDYDNSLTKARSDLSAALKKASAAKDYDTADRLMVNYDYKVLETVYPILKEYGIEDSLDSYAVMDYLKEWIRVPYNYRRTAKGRYVPKLVEGAQTEEAFKKPFIKYLFGVTED